MAKTAKNKSSRNAPNPSRALMILRKIKKEGSLDDRFKGMTDEEVIQIIKQTREEIWKEKLTARS